MGVKIYHNPRCSKSRQTLQILEEKGLEIEVIEYLKNPPSEAELVATLKLLDITPRQLMRKGEKIFKQLNLADKDLAEQQLINAMLENPILIERPIVFSNDKAAIGRPPESVLDIL